MSRAFPVAYSLRCGGGLKLDITLVETGRLLLHEETIPEILDNLVRCIREDGVLRAPVIVDRETLVVLDGMHRVKALRILGCRFACACLVDYRSPEIKVEQWCRTISKPFDAGVAVEVAEELGMRLTPQAPCERSGMNGARPVMVFGDSRFDVVTAGCDLLSAFKDLHKLELRLRKIGFEVDYETALEAEEKLRSESVGAVIYPPKIRKEDVVGAARRGRVFTFKATRHVVPARPVGVNVPLPLLRDHFLSVEEANERLSALLSRRRLRHLPPKGVWMDRRYDEDLYIFEDS